MRILAAAIISGVCVLSAGTAQAEDCTLKLFASIPIVVQDDHVLVPVKLGDAQEDFALKIGNALSGISEDTAAQLGLSLRAIDQDRLGIVRNQVRIAKLARVPVFELGTIPMKNVELIVLPPQANEEGFAGDIGVRLLSKADFELDFAAKKFNVFSQDHCPAPVYWTKTGFAQIPFVWQDAGYVRPVMQLDGHPVRVAIEPNSISRIGMNAMRRVFGVDENSPDMKLIGQDKTGKKMFRYPFKSLVAEGLTINSPAITIFDEPRADGDCDGRMKVTLPAASHIPNANPPGVSICKGGGDLELGYSVLSKLHMFFAIKEKVLYLTGADAH
jgi:hypothetical protein